MLSLQQEIRRHNFDPIPSFTQPSFDQHGIIRPSVEWRRTRQDLRWRRCPSSCHQWAFSWTEHRALRIVRKLCQHHQRWWQCVRILCRGRCCHLRNLWSWGLFRCHDYVLARECLHVIAWVYCWRPLMGVRKESTFASEEGFFFFFCGQFTTWVVEGEEVEREVAEVLFCKCNGHNQCLFPSATLVYRNVVLDSRSIPRICTEPKFFENINWWRIDYDKPFGRSPTMPLDL